MVKKDDRLALERYLEKLRRISETSIVNLNETKDEKDVRITRAKKDYALCFNYYFPHYATSECADFQTDAANFIKKHKECIDAEVWARAHGKSVHMDIGVPFWLWLNDEIDVMLLVGKSEDDAKTLLSDLQAEFEANPQIIADFGEQKKLGSWEDGNFVTKNDVAFFSLGRGQSPRGIRYRNKRPNLVVIDDIDDDEIAENPKRVAKVIKWIWGALHGATDNKGARIIFANNLISPYGIIAKTIEKLTALSKHKKNVRVKIVNALDSNGKPSWHQKYSIKFFEEKKQIIGDYAFQTEQMNNPQIEEKLFKDEDIQWAPLPRLAHFECIVGHWDVAYAGTTSADYNAVKIWGLKEKKFYLIKAFVRQCKMDAPIKFMIEFDKSLPQGVRVLWRYESQFWNDALKMTLDKVLGETKAELSLMQCERTITNKFTRIVSMQPHYQNGKIYYNIKEKFNVDMQTGTNQLKGIEPGYSCHDDSPDADEGAISYLHKFIPSTNPPPRIGTRQTRNGAW